MVQEICEPYVCICVGERWPNQRRETITTCSQMSIGQVRNPTLTKYFPSSFYVQSSNAQRSATTACVFAYFHPWTVSLAGSSGSISGSWQASNALHSSLVFLHGTVNRISRVTLARSLARSVGPCLVCRYTLAPSLPFTPSKTTDPVLSNSTSSSDFPALFPSCSACYTTTRARTT